MVYQNQILNIEKILKNVLDLDKLKFCFECGICTASCPVAELISEHYNPRILLHNLQSGTVDILKSAELWLCAWCNRCQNHCPQKINLPETFQTIRKFAVEHGYFEGFYKALEIIREKIPLPASSCYVCFHPERAIGDKQLVTKAIKEVILDYEDNKQEPKSVFEILRKKVAIIGSGPSGLSAAQDLVKKGYCVTVFEEDSFCGGMLRNCIPEYRLSKKIVDCEIKHIEDLGVKIKKNLAIGENLTIGQLFQDYDAVFVATGAHEEKMLGVKGEELNGVFYALDFLEKSNLKKIKVPGRVLVVGGGDVAIDCARTALRVGAKEATVLYRRSKDEMPANIWEVTEALEEGVKFEFLVSPTRIIGENGGVVGVECVQNELREADDSDRRHPVAIQDSEFELSADFVVIAVGQFPSIGFLPKTVEVTKDHRVAVNPFTLETTTACVFAGGDVASGPATLMEAVLAGKQAAVTIDCYLQSLGLDLAKMSIEELESGDCGK